MGTDFGPSDPTFYSANYLVKPISEYISSKLHFKTKTLLGGQSSKSNLMQSLKQNKPALVFTASHGAGFLNENFLTQKKLNGAIYCQGGEDIPLDDILFTSYDIPVDEAFLEGAIFFQFACFGYGTNLHRVIFNTGNRAEFKFLVNRDLFQTCRRHYWLMIVDRLLT